MASKYSVVQYSPDTIADERINIGVVVTAGDAVRARFVTDWTRVKRFSGRDVGFLKEFADSLLEAADPQQVLPELGSGRLSESMIARASESWMGSIQFTPLRGSLKSLEDLLAEIESRFLATPEVRPDRLRSRHDAAIVATRRIREALQMRIGDSTEAILKTNYRVEGKHQRHRFDAVVGDQVPFFAAEGLSFEVAGDAKLERAAGALAWQIRDVRERFPDFPLGVLALPPVEKKTVRAGHARDMFEEYTKVYSTLGADVFSEIGAPAWAAKRAAELPAAA